jgi:hypothetical protein
MLLKNAGGDRRPITAGTMERKADTFLPDEGATGERINLALRKLDRDVEGKNNTVILFVAGHGSEADPQKRGSAPYFVPSDCAMDDPKLCLPMAEFGKKAQKARQFSRFIVYLDMCYARNHGGGYEGGDAPRGAAAHVEFQSKAPSERIRNVAAGCPDAKRTENGHEIPNRLTRHPPRPNLRV